MNAIACERCGGEVVLIANMRALEAQVDQQVYCCKSCQHLNWRESKPGKTN